MLSPFKGWGFAWLMTDLLGTLPYNSTISIFSQPLINNYAPRVGDSSQMWFGDVQGGPRADRYKWGEMGPL